MAKIKITKREIDSLRADAMQLRRAVYLWDRDLKGFGVRITAEGQISWLIQKWVGGRGGKAKRLVIGHCPPMQIDEARQQASILVGDVHKGIDIVDRKQRRRQEQREAIQASKLGETVELYLKRHSQPGSYWAEVRRRLEKELVARLGKDMPVREITKADVRPLLETMEDKGYQSSARYQFAVLRPFFKWCVQRDVITQSPLDDLSGPKPCKARDRVLNDREVRAVYQAAEQMAWPFGPFYKLLLLTGQRRDEVAALAWSELDLDKGLWVIPGERTKNGKEHTVHLSPQAVAVIRELPRRDERLVFSTTKATPISGFGRAKDRLDALMQAELGEAFKPWRVHDLRRTAASGMAALGFMPHVIERVLNHISGATGGLVGVYQRFDYLDDRKRALVAWGKFVYERTSDSESPTNVVSFEKVLK